VTPTPAPDGPLDPSPVLAVSSRVVPEQGRWAVYLDVVLVPDRADHVEAKRIGDYDSRARAESVAAWMTRTANRTAPPSHGF